MLAVTEKLAINCWDFINQLTLEQIYILSETGLSTIISHAKKITKSDQLDYQYFRYLYDRYIFNSDSCLFSKFIYSGLIVYLNDDYETVDHQGRTILMRCAAFKKISFQELIDEFHVQPDELKEQCLERTDYDDMTLLRYIEKNGNFEMLKLLFQYEDIISIIKKSKHKLFVILVAIKKRHFDIAEQCIELFGIETLLDKDHHGDYLLEFLVIDGESNDLDQILSYFKYDVSDGVFEMYKCLYAFSVKLGSVDCMKVISKHIPNSHQFMLILTQKEDRKNLFTLAGISCKHTSIDELYKQYYDRNLSEPEKFPISDLQKLADCALEYFDRLTSG